MSLVYCSDDWLKHSGQQVHVNAANSTQMLNNFCQGRQDAAQGRCGNRAEYAYDFERASKQSLDATIDTGDQTVQKQSTTGGECLYRADPDYDEVQKSSVEMKARLEELRQRLSKTPLSSPRTVSNSTFESGRPPVQAIQVHVPGLQSSQV